MGIRKSSGNFGAFAKTTAGAAGIAAGAAIISAAGFALHGLVKAGVNYFGPLKGLAIIKIEKMYDKKQRKGEIVFYGASNFTFWKTMEEDIPMFKVQNHGFGGSNDEALMKYADRILYPYQPKVVVFQTGSNDYVNEAGTDAEKIQKCMARKAVMFDTFHKKLPQAKFVVMSGLLLPGRSQFLDMTLEINRQLQKLCEERDYMSYVNAEVLTYADGKFDEHQFVKDGIHLTPEARVIWANEYIIPELRKVIGQLGEEEAASVKK